MELKQVILAIMDRDTLKTVVDDLEIKGVNRRSVEDMRDRVSHSRQATPEMLLAHLREKQVTVVCEQMDVSPKGRRKELMERLLKSTGTAVQIPLRPSLSRSNKTVKPSRKQAQKESPPMADKQNNGNQNEQQSAPVRLPEPPAGMMRVTRTELVWPGKYNEDGTVKEVPRVSLPFQVIETVNESRADREAKKVPQQQTLFDVYDGKEGDSFEEGWKNKLIWGDNLLVMGSLLEKFAGKVDLIYIDPPFDTGADFNFLTMVGDNDEAVPGKSPSIIEEKAYRDTWGSGYPSYLQMMRERLILLYELLSPTGSIFVHLDVHTGPYIKTLLDEIFGQDNFQNEVVWYYYNKLHDSRKRLLPKAFDQILYYVKDKRSPYLYTALKEPRDNPVKKLKYKKVAGKIQNVIGSDGKAVTYESTERTVDNVWRIRCLQPANKSEWTHFQTQKPVDLIERVIQVGGKTGGLFLDAFIGSGSSLVAAERQGMRWIGVDLSRWSIHLTRKRMLNEQGCKPFEVLNLGKYERQYWQGVTFGEKKEKHITEQALYEYLAFILKLYGAQPVAGLSHLHGKKGRAMVHIGAVDAPVTIAEIDAAVEECVQLKQAELHVLGWEWEMGLYDLMVEAAKKKGVKLVLLQIPREVMEQQAAAKGDVRFFELAYLEAEIQKPTFRPDLRVKKGDPAVQVVLKDFVIPNTELIPEEVRSKIKKWSDYIDYWAVDWDFQKDTFMQGWVAFRTRKERKLPLISDHHVYDKPGRYRILVKVIDIFGNDTSQALDAEMPLP
jgi:adenine-specific DNA-methyltransferase